MEIEKLIKIAQDINMLSEAAQLCLIKQRSEDDNCELILPIIGEFSAGKTTLINALTDSKKLETASRPTTATIYEIHFGCDSCYAEAFDEEGNMKRIDDIGLLANDELKDSLVVNVFDTSNRIPSGIILVDTPGLSSPNPRHKQTLVDFLPKADGILLAVDVNQSVTKSLTDFVQTMTLAKRPVFLVLTQCDTKSPSEVESQKKYIADNCNIPLRKVVCVSAKQNQLEELYQLLRAIQDEKANILNAVNAQRIKDIISSMVAHIDNMLEASSSDDKLKDSILEKEAELKQIHYKIDNLISSLHADIEDLEKGICRKFEDSVFEKMDNIVASKSDNYDGEVSSAINTYASIYLNEFRNKIRQAMSEKANEDQNSSGRIDLQSLKNIDISSISVGSLSHNLDLNSIGHEYDDYISFGVKAVVAAIAIYATEGEAAAEGSNTGGSEAASTTGSALKVGTMKEAVEIAMQFADKASEQYSNIETMDQNVGQRMGQKKGIVEGLVGFVTDYTWGKPQRRRAIRMYLDETLMPQFRLAMSDNSTTIVNAISETLHQEAQVTITEKKIALEELMQQQKEQREAFNRRIKTLRDYKNELIIA